MKTAIMGISIMALIFSLSACEDIKMAQNSFQQDKLNNAEQTGDSPMDVFKKGLVEDAEEDERITEYNLYVDFSNFLVFQYKDIINDYFLGVAKEEEFLLLEGGEYTKESFPERDSAFVQSVIDQAKIGTHFPDLDERVKFIGPLILEIMEINNEAAVYGQSETYLYDQYEEAKEIHKRLFPLIEKVSPAYEEYNAAIHSLSLERTEKEMQTLKARGYAIRYSIVKLFSLKDRILDDMERQDLIQADILRMNLSVIRPAHEEFRTTVSELEKLIKDQKAVDGEEFTDPTISADLADFAAASKEFALQIQEMMRRIDQGEGFTEEDYGKTNLDGSFVKIDQSAVEMLRIYNKVTS
ncbi:DUF3829 domain-containing protein [Oribacterium sinus]|uniref:DUF3829 domain-containing protein n=1 Tax=Oribacterium sinus TaxID=237576 RepID=UPI0028E48815|nr:DUF3829 domain-containing protein [Oribacterium sinus]